MNAYTVEVQGPVRDIFYNYCKKQNIQYEPYALPIGVQPITATSKSFICMFESKSVFDEFKSQCAMRMNGLLVFMGTNLFNPTIIVAQVVNDEDIISKVVKNLYGNTTMDVGLYANIRDAIKETIKILTLDNSLR